MAKLTKAQRRNHDEACKLLEKDHLNTVERIFVLENWHEGAEHDNGSAGAHFTPTGLARDFAIDAGGGARVIDLCAGIGGLMFWLILDRRVRPDGRLVCIERNPTYVAVGKKIVPEATWIQADVFDLPDDLGHFDLAISNPPFGNTPREGRGPRYTGRKMEYHVIDIASDLADHGAFIIPQNSAPFRYSGQRTYREVESADVAAFYAQTRIEMVAGCGIDTRLFLNDWKDVSPLCEVVTVEFDAARACRQELGVASATEAAAAAVLADQQLALAF